MSKPKPVCVECHKEMRVAHTGVYVILMAYDPPEPYEIWAGDQWQCSKCGAAFVARYADRFLVAHGAPGFAERLAAVRTDVHYEVYER